MRFAVLMTCDNAAFGNMPEVEVARILHDVATRLEHGGDVTDTWQVIYDANGNDVGRWKLGETTV